MRDVKVVKNGNPPALPFLPSIVPTFFWLVFCACEYGRFFFMRREKNTTIEPMPEQK